MKNLYIAKGQEQKVLSYVSKVPEVPEGWTKANSPKPKGELSEINANGDWVLLGVPAADKVATYRAAVGRHIDQQAQSFGFDSIVTAVTYADEPADPLNQSYGLALRAWRSKCWKKCREGLAAWQGGGAEPTVDELIASLPTFEAP